MALPALLCAAPLVLQGISTIGNIFKSRKAKKQMKSMTAGLNAQNAQMAAQLRQQMQTSLASIQGGYTNPSGISTGNQGIGQMTGGPGFIG
jgi:hypothetical protein